MLTGIRRCGKSSLLKLMRQHLLDSGILPEQIVSINFESMEFREMDVKSLYQYVKERVLNDKRMYFFFDELQRLPQWEDAVNSFRVDFDCDIYITGSNVFLLSSEYSTYLSGRYVEIKTYPLSFREFLDFHGYVTEAYKTPLGEFRKRITDRNAQLVEMNDLFEAYLRVGGMPGIIDTGLEQDKVNVLLDGIYSTVVLRDILERECRRGRRQITDTALLGKVIRFLADNVGNSTSLNTISKALIREMLPDTGARQEKPAIQTIAAYVGALKESYLFYVIKRHDIKGKEELKTLGKYYIADTGLRNLLLGRRDFDTGPVIENIVYFELLRRGYDVAVGKVGSKEVDFIATKGEEKIYYQVTDEMISESTRARELAPLMEIKDNYKKVVIARNVNSTAPAEGIAICRLTDFLLDHA